MTVYYDASEIPGIGLRSGDIIMPQPPYQVAGCPLMGLTCSKGHFTGSANIQIEKDGSVFVRCPHCEERIAYDPGWSHLS